MATRLGWLLALGGWLLAPCTSNGKLDTNFIGMPREGVGASNDAKGHMGRPKSAAASFRLDGGRLELKIHVKYL